MRRHSFLALTVVASAVPLLAICGCQTTKKATGTRFVHFSAAPDQVVAAAEGALEELGLQKVSSSATKLDGQIEARTAQGKSISIQVKKEGEGVSKFSIKVGALGDATISDAIIEKTEARLNQ